ncbi:MAG: tyrosine-type recombinase/integrase [Alphaproteobacteria bacterium]|nr:tyrosine-type recombinase/integrase [Alphaproteobacteria bacterium]
MSKIDPQFLEQSRAAFQTEASISLADVRTKVIQDAALTPIQRRDILSALHRVETLFGKPLSEISARPGAVRGLFLDASPAKLRVSPKTLRNIRALVGQVTRRYGIPVRQLTRRISIAPEWQNLLDRIPVAYQRQALYRLAAYAAVMEIKPEQVSQAALLGLHTALMAEEIVKNPRNILKNTIANWNRCIRSVSGWPQIVLSSPFKTTPQTLPLSAFPKNFQDDVGQWVRKVRDSDALDEDAPVRALRQTTIDHRILQIRQFASALVSRGDMEVEDITSIADLLKPEPFRSGLRFFLERQKGHTTTRLHNMANALRHIAKHHCKFEPEVLTELDRICRKLDPGTGRQMAARNRERLRQFDDPGNVGRLLRFPEEQAVRAAKEKNPLRAAKRMERAVALGILLHTGLRSRTLRSLQLEDFHWSAGTRSGPCHLYVREETTKTDRPLEFELPQETAARIRGFINDYRPRLPGAEGAYLFPGVKGNARSKNAMYVAITDGLRKDAGLTVNPHLLRHAIAKIAVEQNPDAYLAVSRVLGHSSLETTMAHYLGTETKAAGRHLDRLLVQARDNDEQPKLKRGRQ